MPECEYKNKCGLQYLLKDDAKRELCDENIFLPLPQGRIITQNICPAWLYLNNEFGSMLESSINTCGCAAVIGGDYSHWKKENSPSEE